MLQDNRKVRLTNLHCYSKISQVKTARFVAYHEGKRIASAGKIEELLNLRSVRRFLGEKEFLIRCVDSGKVRVVFRGDVGSLKKE